MSKMKDVFLVSACRTPVGRFQGSLSGFKAPELGALAIRNALERAGVDPERVDEVVMGNVLQAGVGQNPARQAARGAGLPDSVPPFTVNKVCGSGLKAVNLAAQAIRAEDASLVVAGGMESMSRAPYLIPAAREGARLGDSVLVDAMIYDGLWDVYSDQHMGLTGELVADKYGISRQAQDEFASESQRRTGEAQSSGAFDEEIFGVELVQKRGGPVVFDKDEHPRPDTSAERLGKLRSAFKDDGTVTAGNASGVNDGGAALVIMSAERARAEGKEPLAKIRSCASAGVDPSIMGMGPWPSSEKALAKAGLSKDDIGLWELNEAFAAQVLAVGRRLDWDAERVNVNGGAIALGHPVGASGARIAVTLLHEMRRRDARRGIAALCIGGGMGIAVLFER